jgi:hypothetical protein
MGASFPRKAAMQEQLFGRHVFGQALKEPPPAEAH